MIYTMNMRRSTGFTLIEILIVLAIIGMLAGLSATAFKNFSKNMSLRSAAQEVHTALLDARNSTLASLDDTVYGVHVDETQVVRFTGATYNPADTSNSIYVFLDNVRATGTPVADDVSFVFQRLTGKVSATGTIMLINSDSSATRTITMYDTGLIEK